MHNEEGLAGSEGWMLVDCLSFECGADRLDRDLRHGQ